MEHSTCAAIIIYLRNYYGWISRLCYGYGSTIITEETSKFFVYFLNLAEIKITFKVSIHENARLRVCIITFYEYKDLHRYTFCFPYAQNDTR